MNIKKRVFFKWIHSCVAIFLFSYLLKNKQKKKFKKIQWPLDSEVLRQKKTKSVDSEQYQLFKPKTQRNKFASFGKLIKMLLTLWQILHKHIHKCTPQFTNAKTKRNSHAKTKTFLNEKKKKTSEKIQIKLIVE